MEDTVRNHLTSPGIWTRALYMVLFAIIYSIAKFILVCTVLFQFFSVLFTGHANEPVLLFGNNLSSYIYQLLRYQTFNSEDRPFPFSDWPDEPVRENVWTEASVAAARAEATHSVQTTVPPSTPTQSEQNVEPGRERSDEDRIG